MKVFLKIKTFYALGLVSIFRVIWYRLGVRIGFNPVKKIKSEQVYGDFFYPIEAKDISLNGNTQWLDKQTYFGWFTLYTTEIPDWHKNVFNGVNVSKLAIQPWWTIADFIPDLGDIKTIWEPSRFSWVICFAQTATAGDINALKKLNEWINDWTKKNPYYLGLNWKCGQEASIRVMHLACAALILKQHTSSAVPLLHLIKSHLIRIAPTIQYAVAQNNNHGTSEAAALYIGGSWLLMNGDNDGEKWHKLGLKWLENRAIKLIEKDGTFSQYSAVYHRLMLDTYSFVEVWRQTNNHQAFSPMLYERLKAAANWLYQITDPKSGDTPNLGANDGGHLFSLTDADYRDSRPSVQLAMALFNKCCAWDEKGNWNLPLLWLNIDIPNISASKKQCVQYDDGGYSLLRNERAFAMLRYPRFHFRPSQCDALHVDFWLDGVNVLRDGGTYSYNTTQALLNYFGGNASHNTVQFDDRNQMPKLSRFLWGSWLKTKSKTDVEIVNDCVSTSASYIDFEGAFHKRSVFLCDSYLKIVDDITGFSKKAVLRWRLEPSDWVIEGNSVSNLALKIVITSNTEKNLDILITQGEESRYYLQKNNLPVLEVNITKASQIITEFYF